MESNISEKKGDGKAYQLKSKHYIATVTTSNITQFKKVTEMTPCFLMIHRKYIWNPSVSLQLPSSSRNCQWNATFS